MKNFARATWKMFAILLIFASEALLATTFEETRDQYNKAIFVSDAERREKVATLTKDYFATLEKLKKEAASRGDLDGALAARNEIDRVNRGQLPPPSNTVPSWLLAPQKKYEQDVQQATKTLSERTDSLKQRYVRDLDELQKQLTVAGDLEGAVAARAEKQRLAGNVSKPVPVAEASPTVPKALPPELSRLGNLTKDLVAYFSLSSLDNGGLTWSRVPINSSFTSQVKIRDQNGHKTADFNEPGSVLKLDPPLKLSESYTLACWLSLPVPKEVATVWQPPQGVFLIVSKESFACWGASMGHGSNFYEVRKPLKGWFHVAVSCNGKETVFYLDSARKGSVKFAIAGPLASIGNQPSGDMGRYMCDSVADCFIFSRDLSTSELNQVASVHPFK